MTANDNVKENAPALWKLPVPQAGDHKYTRGHALVFGGEVMTGASRLAALAALHIGAGLVTLAVPEKVWPVYAASMLSVITRPLGSLHDWQALLEDARINVALVGPGAGHGEWTSGVITAAIAAHKRLVLDADALRELAADESLRKQLAAVTAVCTPHEGEYALLAKALRLDASRDRLTRARELAKALSSIVVLKGSETLIVAADGRAVINRNAPPWLATGGTGDVLAGMIAGLMAQGMDAFDAACAAVYLHGQAATRLGRGLIAEDLLGEIPKVLQAL